MDGVTLGFFAALAVTCVLLVVAMALGHRHRLRGHVIAVGAFVAALLVTLYLAETLGRRFDFGELPMKVHMPFAYLTAGALLLPLGSGVLHWARRCSLRLHRAAVVLFLVLVTGALSTGVWMWTTRRPKAPEVGAAGQAGR